MVLVIIVAIAITFFVVAIAQTDEPAARYDLAGHVQPQAADHQMSIKDLKQKVRLVSLYSTQTKPDAENGPGRAVRGRRVAHYVQTVSDLLGNTSRNSSNIDVELIDPAVSPAKVDSLIAEVTARYGGEVKKYQEFIDQYPARSSRSRNSRTRRRPKIEKLPTGRASQRSRCCLRRCSLRVVTVPGFPNLLDRNQEAIRKLLKQKPPDYKGATGRSSRRWKCSR